MAKKKEEIKNSSNSIEFEQSVKITNYQEKHSIEEKRRRDEMKRGDDAVESKIQIQNITKSYDVHVHLKYYSMRCT